MTTDMERLMEYGCSDSGAHKVCRSRGGESCAFDGAMIVLQPIADAAHLVHGPIACCGNSWKGRGSLSSKGGLIRRGFTTDMSEMDIVYGSEKKLMDAIRKTWAEAKPAAIFVYATCVSGMIGEDIDAACKTAQAELGVPVIPVDAPGFVGPKNLGNRIAGEVLLDRVIGSGEPPAGEVTARSINLIGEYNIAGDLYLVEPVLERAGMRVLSRITGDSTYAEITWAHRAKLNVVVCSRALINVAKEMEIRYGIPYVEVSFFGRTEMTKALRLISSRLDAQCREQAEAVIKSEEKALAEKLEAYSRLTGKKAVLYTGGVKSWSFISALLDLGIRPVAVGTKKSTAEDEMRMKEILGPDAPLYEDVTPRNLSSLLKEKQADILVAGGRNQYLAIKEGYPYVDVNQERHTPYAGYEGLVNLAKDISKSIRFYGGSPAGAKPSATGKKASGEGLGATEPVLIDPLKHSASMGAAMVFQGINRALPIIHGAQGCTFLGKVLLTKHFREPIALLSDKLFAEEVIMGGGESLVGTIANAVEKNRPDVIGILTSGLAEVKGDDVRALVGEIAPKYSNTCILCVSTPDYTGGLESGYAVAVEETINALSPQAGGAPFFEKGLVNVLAGHHLTPADFSSMREMIEDFGLRPIFLPDLSALDGSREGFSPLSSGGTSIEDIRAMSGAEFTLVLGPSLSHAAEILEDRFGIGFAVFDSVTGLGPCDELLGTLKTISGREIPGKYARGRRILIDAMRDAAIHMSGSKVCIALEPDHALSVSHWLSEMGADVVEAVVPEASEASRRIIAAGVRKGSLSDISGDYDLLVSNSHATEAARRCGAELYHAGFPAYGVQGACQRVTVGYAGTVNSINEASNLLIRRFDHESGVCNDRRSKS